MSSYAGHLCTCIHSNYFGSPSLCRKKTDSLSFRETTNKFVHELNIFHTSDVGNKKHKMRILSWVKFGNVMLFIVIKILIREGQTGIVITLISLYHSQHQLLQLLSRDLGYSRGHLYKYPFLPKCKIKANKHQLNHLKLMSQLSEIKTLKIKKMIFTHKYEPTFINLKSYACFHL